jgi:alkaline phosphatase D
MRTFTFLILWLVVWPHAALAGARLSGSMLGPVSAETATIWVQADRKARLAVEYWPAATPASTRRSAPVDLDEASDFTAHVSLVALAPDSAWRYRILLDDQPAGGEHGFRTLPLPRFGGAPFDFTVFLGSCAYLNDAAVDPPGKPYGGDPRIFDTIARAAQAQTRPALMLWLGDHIYLRDADLAHPWGMNRRWRAVRAAPELQELLGALPHYAIWDDHDYGPNDSNRSFVFKAESRRLFQRYWANPGAGLPEAPATFTQFTIGDTAFFLLDDRSFRAADGMADDPAKTLYGAAQLDWLKNALMASRATFKIIAGGSQFLNDASRFEGWQHFPAERAAFLDWLALNRIDGVVFLSGDRHHSELLRRERADSYALHELTCSPLTSGVRAADGTERDNPLRVPGTEVARHNYCTLAVEGPKAQRRLILSVFDADGAPLWTHTLGAQALKTPPPAR